MAPPAAATDPGRACPAPAAAAQEAEEFAEQDKAVKAKVDARNALETYCYTMKQSKDEKLKDKLDEDEKETIGKAVADALEWMEENQVGGVTRGLPGGSQQGRQEAVSVLSSPGA